MKEKNCNCLPLLMRETDAFSIQQFIEGKRTTQRTTVKFKLGRPFSAFLNNHYSLSHCYCFVRQCRCQCYRLRQRILPAHIIISLFCRPATRGLIKVFICNCKHGRRLCRVSGSRSFCRRLIYHCVIVDGCFSFRVVALNQGILSQ